jgi:MYXO-CTERM domain-containing protein
VSPAPSAVPFLALLALGAALLRRRR